MKVLIACEYSGIVRDAFSRKGHDAWSCDLLPTESELTMQEGKHIQGDVEDILGNGWDLMVAHPPCTYLCNSGVRWLAGNEERQIKLWDAGVFFRRLLESIIPQKAVENPIPHKYALNVIGRKYNQIIQPWQFGHPESKKTCLWLKNLPPLMYSLINGRREQRIFKMPPGPNRSKDRAKTYPGIAQAMADQWG